MESDGKAKWNMGPNKGGGVDRWRKWRGGGPNERTVGVMGKYSGWGRSRMRGGMCGGKQGFVWEGLGGLTD